MKTHYFIMSPSCHGNGGWYGSTIEFFGELEELLDICPNEYGWSGYHHPYARDPEPRICYTPDVNDSFIIWDGDDMCWRDKKSNKTIAQFGSTTTYKRHAI